MPEAAIMTDEMSDAPDSSYGIQTVTGSTFDALVLEGEGPIVVEFMSYGCAHCRELEPVLQQVAVTMQPRVKIYRVNVAMEQELAGSYGIEGTPTLTMLLNGNEVGRIEGPIPKAASVMSAISQSFE